MVKKTQTSYTYYLNFFLYIVDTIETVKVALRVNEYLHYFVRTEICIIILLT